MFEGCGSLTSLVFFYPASLSIRTAWKKHKKEGSNTVHLYNASLLHHGTRSLRTLQNIDLSSAGNGFPAEPFICGRYSNLKLSKVCKPYRKRPFLEKIESLDVECEPDNLGMTVEVPAIF